MTTARASDAAAGRARVAFGLALIVTIVLGILSRRVPMMPTRALDKEVGDALWAVAAFLAIGVVKPRAALWSRTAIAAALCAGVECSQLYHAPWIDAVRRTSIGHLFLGFTFSWRDMAAYAFGLATITMLEVIIRVAARRARPPRAK